MATTKASPLGSGGLPAQKSESHWFKNYRRTRLKSLNLYFIKKKKTSVEMLSLFVPAKLDSQLEVSLGAYLPGPQSQADLGDGFPHPDPRQQWHGDHDPGLKAESDRPSDHNNSVE